MYRWTLFLCVLVTFVYAFQNDAEEASNKVLNAYMEAIEEETKGEEEGGTWSWDWFGDYGKDNTLSKHIYSFTESTWRRNHPTGFDRGEGGRDKEMYPTLLIEGLWFLVIGSMLFMCVRIWVFGTVAKIWSVLMSVITFVVVMTKFYRLYHYY
jgi:hypothetical protein